MGKGNALEERELLREPMAGLSLQAKGTTLKQAKCSVRYKKGKTQEAKEVFLHQHELKFFKAGATDFKRADETIPIALITSVKPERSISTPCIVIETRLPAFKKLWMYPPSQAEAAQWIQQLGKLKPTMEAKLKLTDDKGKEKLERHVAWQGNALFTFGAKHFKMKRCYAAKKMSQIELGPKNSFIIHETKVASSFRYLCDSADQAAKWHSFLEDQTLEEQLRKAEADDAVARKAAEKAQAEREKAEKLEQEEQDRAAKQALKEARLQMAYANPTHTLTPTRLSLLTKSALLHAERKKTNCWTRRRPLKSRHGWSKPSLPNRSATLPMRRRSARGRPTART